MSKLSNYLVENILLEETQIKRTIVVYGGRFQPFHKGHYDSYSKLVKKFGKSNVFIGTSDKVQLPKSPFSFKEKVEIMTRMFGIPKNQIVNVKNPYSPKEITGNFDEKTTALVVFLSDKDASRLGGKYFKPWDGTPTQGYADAGYVYTMPPGAGGISGTEVRKAMSSDDEEAKKDVFKKLYPKFDQKIFDLISDKCYAAECAIAEHIHIPKEVIEEWVSTEFKKMLDEVTTIAGRVEVDDGPNFLFPDFETFNKINKRRAEKIGYTLFKQVIDGKFADIDDYPIYPKGPVKAVTPFPAGVIGKVTATNQKDYDTVTAYSKWFNHVTRSMALAGYTLVKDKDMIIKRLSTKGLKTLKGDPTAKKLEHPNPEINEPKVDIPRNKPDWFTADDIKELSDEMMNELMIGYAGEEDIEMKKKQLKKLRKKLDTTTPGTDGHDEIKEVYDKLDFYVNYYKNISPSDFNVIREENGIRIQLSDTVNEVITEATTKLKLTIPKEVLEIHKAFKKAGKKLYVVGGAVRDAILGKSPKDFDLATDAKPDDVLKIAKDAGLPTVEVGKSFGVVVVNDMEIATFRKDLSGGRRPDAVEYTDIKGDVERRDLTINALFYDIDRKEIVDLVGGIADLQNNRIRTVGKAMDRFEEDPLRKLRVLRFAARLGSTIEKDTLDALKADPTLNGVSAERTRDEFMKSVQSAKSVKAYLNLADDTKLLGQIFPNLQYRKSDFIEESNPILLIAYLFRKQTAERMYKYLMNLKYTHDEANAVKFLINLTDFDPKSIQPMKKAQENVVLSDNDILRWGKMVGTNLTKFVKFKLSVKGDEVMQMGYKGKDIGIQISKMETEKFLNESVKALGIRNFKDLFKRMPSELQKRVYNLKNVPQRLDYHPEGNTLKHTITVVNRALKEDDIDLALAAIMHDIGKDETGKFNPKTGYDSHHGHEKVSAQLVKKYSDWVTSMGGNVANIYFIVRNHMRFKQLGVMKQSKVDKLKAFRAYSKLDKFGKHDRGGLDENRFGIVKGFRFVADKAVDGLKRGTTYVIDDVLGGIGNLTILLKKKGSAKEIPIRVRSMEEFYSKVLMKEQMLEFIDYISKEINMLSEGGAYGHLSHPFETDINLTFGQLKDIINNALEGKLDFAREKTDGQNLAVSWVNGKLVAARNKSHLKNRGAGALDAMGLASKFKNRGGLEKAYNLAMSDLTKAISSLNEKQREDIFAGGSKFMSLEVMHPESPNVIAYGQPMLVFHGALEYDEAGNPIGEDAQSGRVLAGMIKQVNQNIQKTFSIMAQPVLELPKNKDLSKAKSKYLSQLNRLRNEFKLKDSDGVQEYHKAWWQEYINKNSPNKLNKEINDGLVSRWALDDKSYRLDNKTISDETVLNWAKGVDKVNLNGIRKDNMMKFEDIFLGVGAEVLSFISSTMVVNPDKAVRSIKDRIDSTIREIETSGDPNKIEKLKLELRRLDAIGGWDEIVPVEGIVFVYGGNTMKLTGKFAAINQILGIMYR